MKREAYDSAWQFVVVSVARQIARRPYLVSSVLAHAALVVLCYYFGSFEPEMRQREADVASSLRATQVAGSARRLQDLETIKQLLEKSANRVELASEPREAPVPPPETPEEMLERARELAQAIDALDQEIKAEELAELLGEPKPLPPVAETMAHKTPAVLEPGAPPLTPDMAADEIAMLEAKARATLAARQERLEARASGVQVAGSGPRADGEGASAPQSDGAWRDTGVRAEIADFVGAHGFTEPTGPSRTYGWTLDFFDRGDFQVPPVDATNLVLGRGRLLGAGGEYANRVYLNSWYIIGPFPGRHRGGLFDNPAYPPEKAVLLDAVYFGKGQRLLKWRYVTTQSYPLVPPDEAEDSVYYGYTEVAVDEACDLTAWIGADDDVQVYLNDRLVWRGGNIRKQSYFNAIFDRRAPHTRDYNRTEGTRVLHFNRGRNKLFFKLSNGPKGTALSFVLTR
jgi:hypothetical protein